MTDKREYAEKLLSLIRDGAKLDSAITWLKCYAAEQTLEDALAGAAVADDGGAGSGE